MSGVENVLQGLPELRDSDAVNLADERVRCGVCNGSGEDGPRGLQDCDECHGRGDVTMPTGREHLSHSSLSTLLACEQKFYFDKVQRLSVKSRPLPLSMGTAFQKAIETGHVNDAADSLATDRQVFDQADADKLRVDQAIVTAAANAYLNHWPTKEAEDSIREYEFRVRLRNPWTGAYSRTFDLLGYADELVDLGPSYEIVENKFVGKIDRSTVRKLPVDRQIALECYGVWRATGKTVTQVRYRFTKKPSIKQRQNESVQEYIDRLHDDYAARPDFYLLEEQLFRSTDDLVRVEAELWRWAEQLRAARRQQVWARNSSHCSDFGGCQFLPLCVGDADASGLYQVRPERPSLETLQHEETAV